MAKKKDDKEKKGKAKQEPKTPTKKKRKVGRPKKRGRKKKYYKPVKKRKNKVQSNKGFGSNVSYNRVRALLWRTHKEDFASYRDFISNNKDADGNKVKGSSIVSQVYLQCKTLECSDEDILLIYTQFKGQDKEGIPPELPADYFIERPYFQLATENLWDGMDERIWIFSPMLITPPSSFLGVLGEDRCIDSDNQIKDLNKCDIDKGDKFVNGKKELFLPFIRYCNQFQHQGIYETSEEVPHVKFMGIDEDNEKPYWNDSMNRWEIQIVPCNPFGDIEDYGFNPDSIDQTIPDEDDLPIIEPPTPTPETIEPESKKLEQVKIEEAKKTGKVERLEMKKKGMIDEIKMWKDIGDKKEMASAIKKLKDINSKIDKLE